MGFTKRTDRMSERNFSRATILREHSSLPSYVCSDRETVWRHGSAISRVAGAHQRQEREKAAKRPMFGLERDLSGHDGRECGQHGRKVRR